MNFASHEFKSSKDNFLCLFLSSYTGVFVSSWAAFDNAKLDCNSARIEKEDCTMLRGKNCFSHRKMSKFANECIKSKCSRCCGALMRNAKTQMQDILICKVKEK